MHRVIVSWNSALLAGAALLLAGGPAAAVNITSLPYTITAPGEYHVTQDLSTATDGIIIQASNVRLYLDSHTLTGDNKGDGVGVGAFSNVLVQGGTLVSFANGVHLNGTTSATLASLTSRGTSETSGFNLDNVRNSAVLNCISINNGEDGINVEGGGSNTIRSCRTVDADEQGIILKQTSNNLVQSNTVQFNDLEAIQLIGATNNLVQDNVVSFNKDDGILLEQSSSSNRIRTNRVEFNGTTEIASYGIHLVGSSSNTVELNQVSSNTGIGIHVDEGSNLNSVVANTLTQNTAGIVASINSGNLLQNNTVVRNGGEGILLFRAQGTRVISNRIEQNNRGIDLNTSTRNTVQYNQIRNHPGNGIFVGPTSTQNNILSNAATGNGTESGTFDLTDFTTNCDQNIWSGNIFGTKNQACIK
jgi:parallel beta-helix repeat protein